MTMTLIEPITKGQVATDMPSMQWTAYFYHVSRDGWVRCGPYVIDHVATEGEAIALTLKWRINNPARGDGYSTVHVKRFWDYVAIEDER